jgi:hypothetical protein
VISLLIVTANLVFATKANKSVAQIITRRTNGFKSAADLDISGKYDTHKSFDSVAANARGNTFVGDTRRAASSSTITYKGAR